MSGERIDHVAEAIRLGQRAEQTGGIEEVNALHIAAQVHATLALVEQQRIANLLAYIAQQPRVLDACELPNEVVEQYVDLLNATEATIREGLGLS